MGWHTNLIAKNTREVEGAQVCDAGEIKQGNIFGIMIEQVVTGALSRVVPDLVALRLGAFLQI